MISPADERVLSAVFNHPGQQDKILPYEWVAGEVGRDSNRDEGRQDRILPYERVAGEVGRDSNRDEGRQDRILPYE